ncbi:hypothetical protein CW304_12110 [Bacillus sp. UFRGS-B20]|nr:hypothetical protein CW304_12110 [Bacillus sp. UFRGS-B20]
MPLLAFYIFSDTPHSFFNTHERFNHCVIITNFLYDHTYLEFFFFLRFLILRESILTPSIAMVNAAFAIVLGLKRVVCLALLILLSYEVSNFD